MRGDGPEAVRGREELEDEVLPDTILDAAVRREAVGVRVAQGAADRFEQGLARQVQRSTPASTTLKSTFRKRDVLMLEEQSGRGSHATSISLIWTSGRCSRQKGVQRPSTSRFANVGSMPKAIRQLGFARAASSARQPRRSAMGPSSSMASACAFAVSSPSKKASGRFGEGGVDSLGAGGVDLWRRGVLAAAFLASRHPFFLGAAAVAQLQASLERLERAAIETAVLAAAHRCVRWPTSSNERACAALQQPCGCRPSSEL